MLDKEVKNKYNEWLKNATEDIDLINELESLDEKGIVDAFYRELEFGTGGLRGVIGAGTYRLNIYTVRKATQGLANYIIEKYKPEDRKVAISFDSRIKSDVFAVTTAEVLAANNIRVYLFPQLAPVPVLSYATRFYKCACGVMITASHNPSKYNGYKVYGDDGCQITTEAAATIYSYINDIDAFNGYKRISIEDAFDKGLVSYITPNLMTSFIEEVKKLSMLGPNDKVNKDFSIVYSPLHGAGLKPVTRILEECGYKNVVVVPEQEYPDGHFTTCPFPNPEEKEALSLALALADKKNADLVIGTDPDCDRVGIAVRGKDGMKLITGDELGILLFDYICSQRIKNNNMPLDPVVVKTIVTTDMAFPIAKHYGVRVVETLTGFKFIGEQIGVLEKQGKKDSFIFGFEESYGVLSGSHVRDKDAVNGAFLLCEMFAFYKSQGISLLDKLSYLYDEYGYFVTSLYPFVYEGESGFKKMQSIMSDFRNRLETGAFKCKSYIDYKDGYNGLPKSNVLKVFLDDKVTFVVRPSGTEPKIKIYPSIRASSIEEGRKLEKIILEEIIKKEVVKK